MIHFDLYCLAYDNKWTNFGTFLLNCINFKQYYIFTSAAWLTHPHLWVNVEGSVSLNPCGSLVFCY